MRFPIGGDRVVRSSLPPHNRAMLGNESNASRRSRGADSGAPPPAELLEFGPGTAGSRKRRLEEEEGADAESLNRAIASVKAVTEDLCAHARAAGGLVSFAGTPDLLGQLDRGVEQVAVLWRPTKENEIKLDEIDALGSTIWNLSINTKKDNGPPGKTAGRTIVADRE